jgi:hypothetical protein
MIDLIKLVAKGSVGNNKGFFRVEGGYATSRVLIHSHLFQRALGPVLWMILDVLMLHIANNVATPNKSN